jgi:hypothetical protein
MAVHVSHFTFRGILLLYLIMLMNEINVAMGVINTNHIVNISAIFKCGQNGMVRSIGKESANAANPNRDGKHQQIGIQVLLGRTLSLSETFTLKLKYLKDPADFSLSCLSRMCGATWQPLHDFRRSVHPALSIRDIPLAGCNAENPAAG